MDEATPLTEIPLSRSNAPQGHGHAQEPHLDTTYGRYERAPFRQYSERKIPDWPLAAQPRRLPSKDSLLKRILSRQSHLERAVYGQEGTSSQPSRSKSGVGRNKSGKRPQPAYSLAGPRTNQNRAESSGGRERPKPQWGLGSPFSHVDRQGRRSKKQERSKRGHPQGQVSSSLFIVLFWNADFM